MQIANRSFVQLMYDANPDIFAKIKAYGLKGGPSCRPVDDAKQSGNNDATGLQEPIFSNDTHHLHGVEFERTSDPSKHLTIEQLAVLPDDEVADVFTDSGFSEPTDASVIKSKPKITNYKRLRLLLFLGALAPTKSATAPSYSDLSASSRMHSFHKLLPFGWSQPIA